MGLINGDQPNLRMLQSNQFAPGVVMTFVNNNGGSAWTRFDLQGTNQALAGIQCVTGGGIIQNLGITGSTDPGNAAATLTLNVAAGNSYTYNGYIRDQDSGSHTDLLQLTKTGSGTQTISGTNVSYQGATTVNGGKLNFVNTTNAAFTSAITVNSGGLVGGSTAGVTTMANSFTFFGSGGIDLVDGSIGTLTLSNASGISLAPTAARQRRSTWK